MVVSWLFHTSFTVVTNSNGVKLFHIKTSLHNVIVFIILCYKIKNSINFLVKLIIKYLVKDFFKDF